MAYNDFGPGQNIKFFLITTGLDINPLNGTVARTNYEYLKTIISESSEIMVEEPLLRQIENIDPSIYLDAYDQTPRNVYQVLFGLAKYSNSWTDEKLSSSISKSAIFPKLKPETGEYSLNPYEFYDNNFGLYKCVEVSPGNLSWISYGDFKITERAPGRNDGNDKALWGVLENKQLFFYVKNAFSWISLEEYIETRNTSVTVSNTTPSLVKGTYWLYLGDVNVYEHNGIGWESGHLSTIQTTFDGVIDGDYILKYDESKIKLYLYENGKYISKDISQYIIRDQALNSVFNNISSTNFLVESGNIALLGGLFSNISNGDSTMIKVYGNGSFIGQFDGLDFHGSNVVTSSTIDNVVEITSVSNSETGGTYGPVVINYTQTGTIPLIEVDSGVRIVVITAEIVEPFTDDTANFTIGDSLNMSRLMGENDSDLTSPVGTVFQVTPAFVYDESRSIILTLDSAISSSGQLKITLSYL